MLSCYQKVFLPDTEKSEIKATEVLQYLNLVLGCDFFSFNFTEIKILLCHQSITLLKDYFITYIIMGACVRSTF